MRACTAAIYLTCDEPFQTLLKLAVMFHFKRPLYSIIIWPTPVVVRLMRA